MVLNRAVLWGFPHRPFRSDDPDLKGAGRFAKHFAVLTCEKDCFKHNDVDSFLHFTAYWGPNVKWGRLSGVLRALYEYESPSNYLRTPFAHKKVKVNDVVPGLPVARE
jgi:hypothetical protein